MATHSSILAGKSHGQRRLTGYTVHGVAKGQRRLSNQAHIQFSLTLYTFSMYVASLHNRKMLIMVT